VKIKDNNILDNGRYSVNMGENQREDLDYTGNWWGATDPEKVAAGMFDGTKDDTLGKVIFEPLLTKPVADCGMRR